MESETIFLRPGTDVPNNPRLPVLLHHGALAGADAAAAEALMAQHGWAAAWRGGLHGFAHFHSTAHEALACIAGEARLRLGGETGVERALRAGDVLVLPAGTGHQRLGEAAELLVVGAYPRGQVADLLRPDPELQERLPALRAHIARLPDPPGCPVSGQPYPRRP